MKKIISRGRDIKITLDIEKLLKMKEELAKKYRARVGVLGQKTNRIPMLTGESHERYKLRVKKLLKDNPELKANESKTNAEIGLLQEMGSLSLHIPRRSFLEMPLSLKMPDYSRFFGNQLMKAIDEGNLKPVYTNLGIKGEQVVQLAFASRGFGHWPENAPYTIQKKGSSTPLIDTGQLRRSVTSDVVTA
jgi:hypothetical protein